jgi:Phytanoyl-CoA dioxygenase (PhyH)
MTCDLTRESAETFRSFGFVVLRHFFDPDRLTSEIDAVMADGLCTRRSDVSEIQFQYVPMMTAQTPESLSLLDRGENVAAALLDGPVLPTRAKGVRYFGASSWHTDSDGPLASVGILAYLEPVGAETGALRVLPGSHHPQFGSALRAFGAASLSASPLPDHAIATEPGDVIVLDERLFHASAGGGTRRQWRVDFVKVPVGAEAVRRTKAYFASIYPPDWDGGYDVDRYPTYGPDWLASSRPAVAELEALGVYELAAAQEAFMRSRRRASALE